MILNEASETGQQPRAEGTMPPVVTGGARAVLSLNLPHQGPGEPCVPPSPGVPLPRGQGFRRTECLQVAAISVCPG